MFNLFVTAQNSSDFLAIETLCKSLDLKVISIADVASCIVFAKNSLPNLSLIEGQRGLQRRLSLRVERKALVKLLKKIQISLDDNSDLCFVFDNLNVTDEILSLKKSTDLNQLLTIVQNTDSTLHGLLKTCLVDLFRLGIHNVVFIDYRRRNFFEGTHYVEFSNSEKLEKDLISKKRQMASYQALSRSLTSRIGTMVNTIDVFDRKNWPNHPLMTHSKKLVLRAIKSHIGAEELLDDKDLLYQTLFRLTTIPIEEAFVNGDKLSEYIFSLRANLHWSNIQNLDSRIISTFDLNQDILNEVILEQKNLIVDRVDHSTLPRSVIKKILHQGGIFDEEGWVLCRERGNIFAKNAKKKQKLRVRFESVEVDFAMELHRVLHYIHTPRAIFAYGLYLEDSKTPFSVVAFDHVEREYKKNALLLNGFNPDESLDLTRLYSSSGTPMNTSSLIFSSAFAQIRKEHSWAKSVMSAFMPTYATGMSMVSAGFYHPMLIKPNVHTFGSKLVNGMMAYEHLTPRRACESSDTISSLWPLLPVIELFAPLTKSFGEHPKVKGKTLCYKC